MLMMLMIARVLLLFHNRQTVEQLNGPVNIVFFLGIHSGSLKCLVETGFGFAGRFGIIGQRRRDLVDLRVLVRMTAS